MSKKKLPEREVELEDLLSVKQAAEQAKTSQRMLRRLAAEGRVPFAELVGTRWTFTEASVKFLLKYYSADERAENKLWKGEQARKKMLAAAAKLDPLCATRQEAKLPQYWERKQGRKNMRRL